MACKSIISVGLFIFLSWCIYNIHIILNIRHIPEIPNDFCWAEKCTEDTKIYPFHINVPEEDIRHLLLMLNNTRGFVPTLENSQSQYGLNAKTIHTLVNFIKNEYNFTERLKYLNRVPQFTTTIQGMKVHFIHIKSKRPKNVTVVPILMLHGWPSSTREFYESIPKLTSNEYKDKFTTELVIPSLVGFGFSDGASKPGFSMVHTANVMRLLMHRLGYERFIVHGSDWGAVTVTTLATMYPESVIGFHSNFCVSMRYITMVKMVLGGFWPATVVEKKYEKDMYPLVKQIRFLFYETGYFHLLGTKPDTIGFILDSSPLALIAFDFEKLSSGKNRTNVFSPSAGLEQFDLTTLVDILLFYYWFPKKSTTSGRYYFENSGVHGLKFGLHNIPIDKRVPCACAYFEKEVIYQPEGFLRDKYTNLIQYNTYPSIGHFAALEDNAILTRDIMSFIVKLYDLNLLK